jgi:nitrite reductase (NADH) small subunit
MSQNFIEIGTLDDIPVRGARQVHNGNQTIAVFRNAKNQIYALEDKCPHSGCPVSNGIVHDTSVTCPIHNWVISLETGQALGADQGQTAVFPVQVISNKIILSLPTKK